MKIVSCPTRDSNLLGRDGRRPAEVITFLLLIQQCLIPLVDDHRHLRAQLVSKLRQLAEVSAEYLKSSLAILRGVRDVRRTTMSPSWE
jgi:hypothetical protein